MGETLEYVRKSETLQKEKDKNEKYIHAGKTLARIAPNTYRGITYGMGSVGLFFSAFADFCTPSVQSQIPLLQKIEQEMQEEELRFLLFPERIKKGNGYLLPDFKWEEFQMRKHQSSLRLCWRRYCKRALKQNHKAYSWVSFVFFYGQFRKPCSDEDDPKDKVRNKLKRYNLLLSYCNPNGEQYQKLKKEKEEWLKSLHFDESKIVDKTYEL